MTRVFFISHLEKLKNYRGINLLVPHIGPETHKGLFKILLAHEGNSTLQELSIESENIMQMHLVESLFGSQN